MAASRTPSQLDVYDAAHLGGGPPRVVDTAIVALVRSGRVRVHSPGQLATVELTRQHPVEAAVLDAVGPSGHRSVDTVQWRLQDDARLLEVGRRLRSDGLAARSVLGRALGRGRATVALTADGRRALAWLRDQWGETDDVWRVALHGRAAVHDGDLRAAVFEPPRTDHDLSRRSVRAERHRIAAEDPGIAARQTYGTATGGAAATGFLGGGAGDGGGL
ncbi:TIGR04222 domain-containing membrane protein [Geodermatophilus sp. SYSU D00710]